MQPRRQPAQMHGVALDLEVAAALRLPWIAPEPQIIAASTPSFFRRGVARRGGPDSGSSLPQ